MAIDSVSGDKVGYLIVRYPRRYFGGRRGKLELIISRSFRRRTIKLTRYLRNAPLMYTPYLIAKALSSSPRPFFRSRQPLVEPLVFMALAAVAPNKRIRTIFEKHPSNATGKTWKSLKNFPQRVERMADEIRQIARAEFVAPQKRIPTRAGDKSARAIRSRLRTLPKLMNLYADALSERIRLLEQLDAESSNSAMLGYLTDAVQVWTGKPGNKHIASLLRFADRALGGNKEFDELSIARFRSRRKKAVKRNR